MTCGSHDALWYGFLCMIIFLSGGVISVLFESNGPSRAVYTDILCLCSHGHSVFNVIIALWTNQSQRFMGKLLSVIDNSEMKLSLHIRIYRLDEFWRWICGGTSWCSTFPVLLKHSRTHEASFSSQWIFGWDSLSTIFLCNFSYSC